MRDEEIHCYTVIFTLHLNSYIPYPFTFTTLSIKSADLQNQLILLKSSMGV